ncbi:MAG: hypothetical protein AAB512_04090 [Patescibacteria group bacterium]
MASCELLSKFIGAVKRELAPLSPEEDLAVRAGNQIFSDQQRGILNTPDEIRERLEQLDKSGVNIARVLEQSAAMQAAQNSSLTFRS